MSDDKKPVSALARYSNLRLTTIADLETRFRTPDVGYGRRAISEAISAAFAIGMDAAVELHESIVEKVKAAK